MIKRVVAELEDRFHEQIQRTRRSRFRHSDDLVLDHLHPYYAQITGKAVAGSIRYDYVDLGDRSHQNTLERLLAKRDSDVFCLNDDPVKDAGGIDDDVLSRFLEEYYPVRSRWESSL
jgi:hypothetical protein